LLAEIFRLPERHEFLIFSLLDGKFSSMKAAAGKVFSSEKSIDNVTSDEGEVHALSRSFFLRKLRFHESRYTGKSRCEDASSSAVIHKQLFSEIYRELSS
jgi:hypothetical protein